MEIALIIFALLVTGMGLSLLLSRFFRKKWISYVPSMIGILMIAYITLKIYFVQMEGHIELGYQLVSLMVLCVMLGNIVTNVIIHIKRK